jgi:hypothetical protein
MAATAGRQLQSDLQRQTGYHQLTQDIRETMTKSYRLLGADGRFYSSTSKGLLGGNNRGKIYGRLDCPSALRAVKRGQTYQQHRVFSRTRRGR